MTRKPDIKKILIKTLGCIFLVCAFCMISSDVYAQKAGCGKENKCYPGCKYNSVESCTLCPLFVVVFNTVSKVGSLSTKNFSAGIVQVVIVFFAVWLAMEVIKFVASMKTKDLKDFVQMLITRGFILILVVTILKTGVGNFYNIFIQPVYNTAQSMAQIMFEDGNGGTTPHPDDKKAQKDKSLSEIKEIENGLPSSIGISIVKTMTMMENRVRQLNALGSAVACSSFQDGWFIFPKLKYLLFGGIVWILTIAIIVMVPFIMIDAVFQLGVATALMPFAVGAYAFEYTRKYCKKVWETFLNSAFSFLFTSAIVLILLGAIQSSTQSELGGVGDFNTMFVIGNAAGDIAYTNFKETVNWLSPMFLNLIFIFLLAWAVMNMGNDFAKKFAGSLSSTNIGSEMAARAGSMAKGAAMKATAPARNAMSKGAKWVGQRAVRKVGQGISSLRSRGMRKRIERNKDKMVANDDGTSSVEIKGKKYTLDKDGNITREKNKEKVKKGILGRNPKKRLVTEKEIRTESAVIKRKTIKIMEQKDGQWVEVKSSVVDKVRITKDIEVMNKNGSFNPEAMAEVLKGTSGEVREMLRNNMIRSITASRFSKAAFDPASENLASAPETSIDPDTGEIVTKYVTKNGQVVVSKTKLRPDGIVESKLTRVDKNGHAVTFESDGIRNKMTIRLLNNGVDASKMSLEELDKIEENCKKDKNGRVVERVGYSYTEYYQVRIKNGEMSEAEVPNGMFMHTDADGITRDENGEIVRDKHGNIVGGAFKRYQKGLQNDHTFMGRDNNVGNYGTNESMDKKAAKAEYEQKKDVAKDQYREQRKWKRGDGFVNNISRRIDARKDFREAKKELKEEYKEAVDEVKRNKKELDYDQFISSSGNDYAAREADMNHCFTNSKSPKRIRTMFWWS